MARMRFVQPETVRIPLSDGDWLEVKKFLNSGDQARKDGAGVPAFRNDAERGGQSFDLDFVSLKHARIEVYVVAWSFVDAKGNQTQPTRENIGELDTDTIEEIDKALDAHVKAMDAEKNARRSAAAGATA